MLIYKITNDINSKVYIGQTTKPLEERIAGHHAAMVSGASTHICNAFRKYGWDKFHFEVIATTDSQDTLNELEEYYIAKYDSIKNGYNMAPGGNKNSMYSPTVKEKHDNIMRSESVRHKISESMKKSYRDRGGPSVEHRKHLFDSRKALYNSPKGDEVRAKFKNSFKLSPEHYKAVNQAKYKAVYCIDEAGKVVAEFNCVKDASTWWYSHGYGNVKHSDMLCDRIKESSKYNKYIKGLKWIYRV